MRHTIPVFSLIACSLLNLPLSAQEYSPASTPVAGDEGVEIVTEKHPNGSMAKRHYNLDGKASGLWQEWDDQGRPTYLAEWRDGKGNGVWYYFHPTGVVSERSWVIDDVWHGPSDGWHANGARAFAGAFDEGSKAAPFRYWMQDGTAYGPLTEFQQAGSGRREILAEGWAGLADRWEFTFSRDLETIFVATADEQQENRRIVMRRWRNGVWQAPETAPFSDPAASEGTPVMGPGGDWLYFSSNRHASSEPDNPARDIYRASRKSGWMEVERVTNTPLYGEISFSLDRTGRGVVWTDRRMDGERAMGLYEVEYDGNGVRITGDLNDLHRGDVSNENYAAISPDGSFVIFANYDIGAGGTDEDLFVIRRTASGWSQPEPLGPLANTARGDTGPVLSPDGKFLFLVSGVEGGHKYYAVELAALEPFQDD